MHEIQSPQKQFASCFYLVGGYKLYRIMCHAVVMIDLIRVRGSLRFLFAVLHGVRVGAEAWLGQEADGTFVGQAPSIHI